MTPETNYQKQTVYCHIVKTHKQHHGSGGKYSNNVFKYNFEVLALHLNIVILSYYSTIKLHGLYIYVFLVIVQV